MTDSNSPPSSRRLASFLAGAVRLGVWLALSGVSGMPRGPGLRRTACAISAESCPSQRPSSAGSPHETTQSRRPGSRGGKQQGPRELWLGVIYRRTDRDPRSPPLGLARAQHFTWLVLICFSKLVTEFSPFSAHPRFCSVSHCAVQVSCQALFEVQMPLFSWVWGHRCLVPLYTLSLRLS